MLSISRRLMLGGATGAASLASIGSLRAQQANPIRIGLIQTLSGSVGDLGRLHLLGAQIAVKQINDDGGINGRPIELVVRDAHFNAADAISALHEFAGMGINLVHGEIFSPVVFATLPLLPQLKIVNISPSINTADPTHDKYTRYFFRCAASGHMQYGGQGLLMAKVAPKAVRWSGVVSDYLGAKQIYDTLTIALKKHHKRLHGQDVVLVDPVLTKPGSTDFRNAAAQAVSLNLDGVHIGLPGGEAVSFCQQAKPFGLFQTLKAVSDTTLSVTAGPSLRTATPPNFWSACLWHIEGYKQVKLAQRFHADVLAETKLADVNPFTAQAHTAIMSFAGAIRAAGGTETEKVIAALESITFDSVFGALSYRPEDHQLRVNPGFLHVEPVEREPFYRNAEFVSLPWQDLIEPPTPGKAFVEE